MKRDLQQNDIRTNILLEFNVTGVAAANELLESVQKAVYEAKSKNLAVHWVGLTLKKPTCGFEIISTKYVIRNVDNMVQEANSELADANEDDDSSDVGEEVHEDD